MDDFRPVSISSLLRITHCHDGTIIAADLGDINLMHWNINHMTNKFDEVELQVASYPGLLHIIAISETWLNKYNYSTYQLPGYMAIHNVRSSDGGGISLFIHESLCDTIPD